MPTPDYVRFFCDELFRVLRTGGTALVSIAQTRQAGYSWPRGSSAMLGNRTDPFVVRETLTEATHSRIATLLAKAWLAERGARLLVLPASAFRVLSVGERDWLRQARDAGVLPLELVVGAVASNATAGCSPTKCTERLPKSCQRKPGRVHGVRGGEGDGGDDDALTRARHPYQRSCAVAFMHGTRTLGGLYIHKFEPAARTGAIERFSSRCVRAAKELPLLRSLGQSIPGKLLPETAIEGDSIAAVLRARERPLRANKTSEWKPSSAADAESVATGVRLWYRERKPCHLPATRLRAHADHATCAGAPRIVWSGLHVYVADIYTTAKDSTAG